MSEQAIQLINQAMTIAEDLSRNGPGGWAEQGTRIATLLQQAKNLVGAAPETGEIEMSDIATIKEQINQLPDAGGRLRIRIELPTQPPHAWSGYVRGWERISQNELVLRGYV